MTPEAFLEIVRGRLIVSCQALPDEPLHGAHIMARMALAAALGGASAIRANGPDDIRAIKATVNIPVIGLYKDGDSDVYITPTIRHALDIVEAGADMVAIDATQRPRPNGDTLTQQIEAVHARGALVLADVSTLAEAQAAVAAGADFVAPTLSGYTPYSPKLEGPDYALIHAMAQTLPVPIIGEGRVRTPYEARLVLDYGAAAIVVGSAITRPMLITEQFVKAIKAKFDE